MTFFNALLDGAAAGWNGDTLPAVGEEINIAGARARVWDIATGADGQPVIMAERLRDETAERDSGTPAA